MLEWVVPDYEITLKSNGEVRYEGTAVDGKGTTISATIPQAAFADLARVVNSSTFGNPDGDGPRIEVHMTSQVTVIREGGGEVVGNFRDQDLDDFNRIVEKLKTIFWLAVDGKGPNYNRWRVWQKTERKVRRRDQ